MDAIKRWLDPKGKDRRSRISSPVSNTFEKLTDEGAGPHGAGAAVVAINFVPQDRGRKETIEFLKSCTTASLARLLREQDRAEREVRRGPKSLGNIEVQNILRRPSHRAVERFLFVRRQAEVAIRYGAPGAVAYNFSRSLQWNKTAGPALMVPPPPQLRNPGHRASRPSSMTIAPGESHPPIDWLELPKPETEPSSDDPRSSSPITEPGGWRDTSLGDMERPESRAGFERGEEVGSEDVEHPGLPRIDTDVRRELGLCDDSHRVPDSDDVHEDQADGVCEDNDEWETSEAQVVEIAAIPVQQVRKVYVKSPRHRPVLQPIEEVSSPEERRCADF